MSDDLTKYFAELDARHADRPDFDRQTLQDILFTMYRDELKENNRYGNESVSTIYDKWQARNEARRVERATLTKS
jgi:hypothetical protein